MKVKYFMKKFAAFALGLGMTVGVSYGLGNRAHEVDAGSVSYTKITSTSDLTDGNYLIVYEDGPHAWNGLDAANGYVEVVISNNVISDANGAAIVEIKAMTGGYSLKITSGDKAGNYVYGKSGSNTVQYGTDAIANEITFSEGLATILSNSTSLRYNSASGNDRFRYYKTSTTGASYICPALYKETGGDVPPTSDTYTVSFELGEGSGTEFSDRNIDITKDFTIPSSSKLTCPEGKEFVNWSGSDGEIYADGFTIPGGTFAKDYQLTLTANYQKKETIDKNIDVIFTNKTAMPDGWTTTETGGGTSYLKLKNSEYVQFNDLVPEGFILASDIKVGLYGGTYSSSEGSIKAQLISASDTVIESSDSVALSGNSETKFLGEKILTKPTDSSVLESVSAVRIVMTITGGDVGRCGKATLEYKVKAIPVVPVVTGVSFNTTLQTIDIKKGSDVKLGAVITGTNLTGNEEASVSFIEEGGNITCDKTTVKNGEEITLSAVNEGGEASIQLVYNEIESNVIELTSSNPKTLTGIEITTVGKTAYVVGESFDASGYIVKASYDGQTEKEEIIPEWSKTGSLSKSDTSVTASYSEGGVTKSVDQSITVTDDYVIGVDFDFTNAVTRYKKGSTWDNSKTGVKATAHYVLAADVELSSADLTYEGYDLSEAAAEQEITVSYDNFSDKYNIEVYEISGIISEGNYKIHHTRENTTYYMVSNGSSAPTATTDASKATIFTFTLVDTNTYTIMDGENYLYCLADNNGVRVGNTQFTWIIENGESSLSGSYNIKQVSALKSGESARYLTLYNKADFRCYNSATASNRGENTDLSQVLTLKGISISGTPIQTSYLAGESFNPEGLTVTASYEASSTTVNVTDKVTWSPNPLTEGTTKVTATYTENDVTKTADYEGITVDSEPEDWAYNSLSLEVSDEWKNEYFDGDELSLEGLSATANYTSASTGKEKHVLVENIEDVVFDFDSSTGGTKVLHGSYTIEGVTKTSTDNVEYTVTVVERYSKVTNIDEVLPGENIIFFNETAKKANAGLSEPNKDGVSYMLSVDALFENNKVIMNDNIKPLEIGRDSGYWTFGLDSQLLGADALKSLCLDDGECTWTISIAEGVATISSTNSAYGAIYYNSSSPRFLNYTSTQAAVQLYKSSSIEAENALAFIKYFMAIDDATLVSTWSEVKAEFNKYSGIAAYFKGNARSDGILVERMLAKYDNVVSMYNLEDFLQRDVEIYQYSITINDGISGERVETQPYNTDFTLPAAPEKHGFDFLGWSVNDKDPVKSGSVKVLGDMSVVAVWSQKTALHVTYNTNGGSQVVDQTIYYAGESVELLNAPTKENYSFTGWEVNGETKQPGETFIITQNTEVKALWVMDIAKISVSTEANFKYSIDNSGKFDAVTQTTLRMYISLDEATFNYYIKNSYTISLNLDNLTNIGKSSSISFDKMLVEYNEENKVYVLSVALNIPSTQYSTELAISLVATKDEVRISTESVTVSYIAAAQALYDEYLAGTVGLTENQLAALKTILKIND